MARTKNLYSNKDLTEKQIELRDIALEDLRAFVGLVAPHLHLGHCHQDLLSFLMQEDEYQLVLWPRGHLKSTILAYYTAWTIVRRPDITIVYLSATSDLAEKQVGLIKNILDSTIVHKYWPDLLPQEEGRREMWRTHEFAVGHWKREAEVIRDPTLKAAGITGNITGFHADLICLDDLVTADNVITKTSRDEVEGKYSYLSSILNAGGSIKAVGTRYHMNDLYGEMMKMTNEIYDESGQVVDEQPMYTVTQEVVETDGQFLWPRTRRKDGKWFGFNQTELAKKRANYLNKASYFAQYYNDPSDPENQRINTFQYYDREQLTMFEGRWCINGNALNVYAAIDFAASITAKADYTAIVIVGVDNEHRIFILDIDRFKTDKISVMTDHLETHYNKWKWIRLRAEVNAQQGLIVQQIRDFNRKRGIFYSIDTVNQIVNKEIRIMTNLEPRYSQGMIYHFRGGNCQILEDELIATKPSHDDVSDALASVVEIATAPQRNRLMKKVVNISTHPQFGGVSS